MNWGQLSSDWQSIGKYIDQWKRESRVFYLEFLPMKENLNFTLSFTTLKLLILALYLYISRL